MSENKQCSVATESGGGLYLILALLPQRISIKTHKTVIRLRVRNKKIKMGHWANSHYLLDCEASLFLVQSIVRPAYSAARNPEQSDATFGTVGGCIAANLCSRECPSPLTPGVLQKEWASVIQQTLLVQAILQKCCSMPASNLTVQHVTW